MIKILCPVCEKPVHSFLVPSVSDGSWKMYVCPECKTHFQYPNKQSSALYDKDYFEGSTDHLVDYSSLSPLDRTQSAYKIPYLSSFYRRLHAPRKSDRLRFLDIGPGNGSVLIEAQKYFDAYALDITRSNEQIMRKNGFTGILTITNLETKKPTVKKNYFDIIHLSEVVEHLSKPDIFIKNVSAMLKPGGIVFIQTNRSDSFTARREKEKWEYYRLVHSIIYSRESLTFLLKKNGLEVISFRRDFEKIPQAINVFIKSKHTGYIIGYFLGRIMKDLGRMQIIAIKR